MFNFTLVNILDCSITWPSSAFNAFFTNQSFDFMTKDRFLNENFTKLLFASQI